MNESKTIARIVTFTLRHPVGGEVLVEDDGSIDGTPDLARAAAVSSEKPWPFVAATTRSEC